MSFNSIDARLEWRLVPEVVFTPNLLDFGQLDVKVKAQRELYVSNLSGPIHGCAVICSSETSWFRLVHVHPIEDELNAARLKIVVEVDASSLSAGQTYFGWIEVQIEHVQARIQVMVTICGERLATAARSPWFQTFALTLTAIILVSGALSLLSSTRTAALASTLLPDFAIVRPWPDRQLLGFSAYTGEQLMLYTTAAGAAEQQNLGIAGWSPAWSPNGAKLAFFAEQAGTPQLYLFDSGGKSPIQLTNSVEPKSAPAWSPDGDKVAFIAGPPAQGVLQIINSRALTWGSGTPVLAGRDRQVAAVNALMRTNQKGNHAAGVVRRFAWSPADPTLLFDYYQAQQARILQVNGEGEITEVATNSWSPTWSPDGKAIAAVAPDGLFRLTMADHQRYVLSHLPANVPAWSPDGSRIAFLVDSAAAAAQGQQNPAPADHHSSALWVIDATGDHETFLVEGCVTFAWSPDGQRLAYVTGAGHSELTGAAPAKSGLYYLWTIIPGNPPTLLAEINSPTIAWQPLP